MQLNTTILEKTSATIGSFPIDNHDPFSQVNIAITPLRQQLLNHRVYDKLTDVSALRIFMEHHCYAVWDFMCLLKCLQNQLTGLTVPWKMPANMKAARMINEIVIAEETDLRLNNQGYASHFELYLDAMDEIGADTHTICHYIDLIAEGMHWKKAMQRANIPPAAIPFITETLTICEEHPAYEVAAFFLFGRENLLPDIFRQIVETLAMVNKIKIDGFRYYLERHIEIDDEEHGPASVEMMKSMCEEQQSRWRIIQRTATKALTVRLNLWNGIANAIDS